MTGPVTACRACGGRLSVTMADLGVQPPSNAFLASMAEAANEKRYPLRAKVCAVCKLVQVDYDVAPEELFGNYVVIRHGGGEFSTYEHLRAGSVKVKKGDAVRRGP